VRSIFHFILLSDNYCDTFLREVVLMKKIIIFIILISLLLIGCSRVSVGVGVGISKEISIQ